MMFCFSAPSVSRFLSSYFRQAPVATFMVVESLPGVIDTSTSNSLLSKSLLSKTLLADTLPGVMDMSNAIVQITIVNADLVNTDGNIFNKLMDPYVVVISRLPH